VGNRLSDTEAPAVSFPDSETSLPLDGLVSFDGLVLFVVLSLGAAMFVPLLAWSIRRSLPVRRSDIGRLAGLSFGSSQKGRRSPRHAILLHRGLIGAFFMALVALFVVPAAASLSTLGVTAIPTALAFVLPTLLVTLHARRRRTRE
jgi:hypothetical protein